MSTFGGLNIAYTGLGAARAGLDVTGQNIANVNTKGYTRQRVDTVSTPAPAQTGFLTTPHTNAGEGTKITGISRLGDLFMDGNVRRTAASSGFSGVRATTLTTLEDSFNEPGTNGLSTQLGNFWNSWQDLANHPGDKASGSVVLETANVLTTQIATGYRAAAQLWTDTRQKASDFATQLNQAADQVGVLNHAIQQTLAAGGTVNELLDQRSQLTATISQLAGGAVNERADGTVDVLIGGNVLVSGSDVNHVQVAGSQSVEGVAASPVQLEWVQRPGQSVGLENGSIAGALALLAPANANGTGGELAETTVAYNNLATQLAAQVNTIHNASQTADGRTGLDFFSVSATGPAALGVTVVPLNVNDIAVGKAGAGALDGSAADIISQIGKAAGSPDNLWSNLVSKIGVQSKSEQQQSVLADTALKNASDAQASNASVDMDEENMNMLMYQHAYQGAARVMTAVDEMLDTLINKTGLVGR